MSFGFDPFAFCLAILVAWIAFREMWRNNRVVIRVNEFNCTTNTNIYENNQRPFTHLKLVIKNLGVPLYNVRVVVQFNSAEGGSFQFQIPRRVPSSEGLDQLAKGMIAEFGLKTYMLAPHDREFISLLRDPIAQRARLVILSQGYEAKSVRVGNALDRAKAAWNDRAIDFNLRLHEEIQKVAARLRIRLKPLDPMQRISFPLPTGKSLIFPFQNFLSACQPSRPRPHRSAA